MDRNTDAAEHSIFQSDKSLRSGVLFAHVSREVSSGMNLREQAYRDLEQSVLKGEFGPIEKPAVAYLPEIPHGDHRGRFPLRLAAGQLIKFRQFNIVPDL
jgi:hypothetical protein